MITSVNSTNGMRYRLRQNFHSDIVLQFNDQEDYSVIIGNTHKLYPSEIYGRGLVKQDNIYEFQTAHIVNDEELLNKISSLRDELREKYKYSAREIPVVPKEVYVNTVIDKLSNMREVPIGINKNTILPEMYNFKDNYMTIVTSNDLTNQNTFVKGLSHIFAEISDNNVLLIDSSEQIRNVSNKVSYINNNFDEVIKKLCDNIEYQYNEYVKNNYNSNILDKNRNMVVIFYGFSRLLLKINTESKNRLLDLLEKGKNTNRFNIIIFDQVNNLKKYEYDSWFKNIFINNYGIWIGNGVLDQTLIKTNINFRKNNNEIPNGYGIVIKDSQIELVNLIKEQEDGDMV